MNLPNKDIYAGVQQIAKFANRDVPMKIALPLGRCLVALREQYGLIK